uniref:Long-chain-fatty-acid--CoA ligase n=1 Tax=Angiostrongylus cantonensis TaxID=6313 RepID=A0A0K0CY01_ANGCA
MMRDTAVWMLSQCRGFVDLLDHTVVGKLSSFPPYYHIAAVGVATMGLGYYLTKIDEGKIVPLVDPLNQTIEEEDGSRVSAYLKNHKLQSYVYDDVRTLYEGVRRGARVSNNGPMLGHRVKCADGSEPYQWFTYNEIIERTNNVSMAFRELGVPVGNDVNIGIYSKNRPEWIITELAAYNFSNVIVPIYETLGFEACVFIINQTEMQVVVCDSVEKAVGLVKQKANCPHLRTVIVMEPITDELSALSTDYGVQVLTMDEVENIGRLSNKTLPHQPPKPEDLSTICYTSGTTGTPKGVMLTHANVIADGVSMDIIFKEDNCSRDVMISFLPLAHMFERLIESVCFTKGARVGFYRGDIRLLAEDIKELQPTVMPVVPRVLNRLYDRVITEVNKSFVKKMLFNFAIRYKKREMENFIIRNTGFFDKLVFKKIREGMGGRVRLMITGSAPLSENVLTFVRATMGCVVVEGYGQTECVAACTVSMEGDSNAGHVGMPIPSASIKLVDVPELGYFSKDGAGEVCVKGPIVFHGYYKNEELTKEVLDKDGWLHTGDIGRWTNEGALKIVDRKKHIFKLAQGEYVAPEKIENVYVRSRFVAQSFVHGESLKSCLVGIVVPDPEELIPACQKQLNLSGTLEELCANKKVVKMVFDDIIAVGKKAGLFSFEQVKDVVLSPNMFTVENDLLTPTLKSKRSMLKSYFANEIASMYSALK